MAIIAILGILGILVLLFVNINLLWAHGKGGRYGGFPNLAALLSLIGTLCVGVYFMYSQGYMN